MNYFLGIVGSAASIVSVPLAIYLYLRSREAAERRIRQEIAKILSYQIGENRLLSGFEIQAVIDSECRENRVKLGSITPSDVIEDLVSDTITNPMLNSERKEHIIRNLRAVHEQSEVFMILSRYIPLTELVRMIKAEITHLAPEDEVVLSRYEPSVVDASESLTQRRDLLTRDLARQQKRAEFLGNMSGLFAGIATVVGVFSLVSFRIGNLKQLMASVFGGHPLLNYAALGAGASLIAGIVILAIEKWVSRTVPSKKRS